MFAVLAPILMSEPGYLDNTENAEVSSGDLVNMEDNEDSSDQALNVPGEVSVPENGDDSPDVLGEVIFPENTHGNNQTAIRKSVVSIFSTRNNLNLPNIVSKEMED